MTKIREFLQRNKNKIKLAGARSVIFMMLFLMPSITFAMTPQEAQDQINSLNTQNNSLQQQINGLQGQKGSLKNTIALYNAQITQLQVQINSSQAQIELAKAQIEDANKRLAQAQIDLKTEQDYIKSIILTMYEEGQVSTIELLAKSQNFSDFVNKDTYLEAVRTKVQESADKIASLQKELEQKKKDIQEAQAKQEELKAQITAQQIGVYNQKAQSNYLLGITLGSESNYQSAINKNSASIGLLQCIASGGCNGDSGGSLIATNTPLYYRQQNYSYEYDSGYSIANYGCLITSLAMAHGVDPITEAKRHTYSNGEMNSVGGRWGNWSSLSGYITSNLAAGRYVIVGLNMAGGYTHFVLIKSSGDGKYYINDPAFGNGQSYSTSRVYEAIVS